MKKKLILIICAFIALIIIGLVIYPPIGCSLIENSTWDYLTQNAYTADDIQLVSVDHNYVAGILGYGQWITEVIFTDEPYISYKCIIKGALELRVTGLYAAGIRKDIPYDYTYIHENSN